MKYIFITILVFFSLNQVLAQNRQNEIQTNSRLALQYYNAKDFEKAAPLLYEVYNLSRNNYYFRLYLNSLTELQRFEEAEEQIQKEIKKQRTPNPEFYIHWGYVLKAQKKPEEAEKKYAEAFTGKQTGNSSIDSRMAFGALIIWKELNLSDEETVTMIRENPHCQYFLGLSEFTDVAPFDSSKMVASWSGG